MAQPIWNTTAGSIGSFPSVISLTVQLSASVVSPAVSITYILLSGSLPNGITMNSAGLITGTPTLVTADTLSIFTIRATDNLYNVRDRTFSMNISGVAIPEFTTPTGSILTTPDSVWINQAISYSNPYSTNRVVVELQEGTLPPGLEINDAGLIRGYPNPPILNSTLNEVVTNATRTTASSNLITCTSTNAFTLGRPVIFTHTAFGGIDDTDTTYYIKSIDTTTTFTISTTQNGDVFALTTASGSMIVTLPSTSVGSPTTRTYSFILRLVSELGGDTSAYTITVINQNTPGNPYYVIPGQRVPTILNTRPRTFIITDSDPYYGYYILPPVLPADDAAIGTIISGEYFAFKVIGYDFDGSTLNYNYTDLPAGLTGDVNTGWITGTPTIPDAGLSSYNFSVIAYKEIYPDIETVDFNFTYTVSKDVTGNISWITPGELDTIFNGTISTLSVNAVSDVVLKYEIASGSLPPNLILLDNGEITGRVAEQPTDELLEQYTETIFTFTVRAYAELYTGIESEKTFTVTVLQEYSQPTDILYIKAAPSINDRNIINTLLTSDTLIPEAAVYRPDDIYFGKASSIIYEHAYGIYASGIDEYLAAVTQNHYWRNITLGEIKTALAKNSAGEIIYEVVYSEVVDNLVNPSGVSIPSEIHWPRPIDLQLGPWYTSITNIFTSYYFGQPGNTLAVTATTITTNLITCSSTVGLLPGREVIFSGTTFGNIVAGTTYYVRSVDSLTQFTISTTPYYVTAVVLTTATGSMTCTIYEPTYYTSLTPGFARTLYPNSLYNMRTRVAQVLGQEHDSRLLPLWMTSQQSNGGTLGYTQAWVICYTKPGFATTIKENIQNDWQYTLNQINFKIDRFSVDKSDTYNYDSITDTWDALPSATPTPDPLNSEDFYVLFPRTTILPDETQY